MVEGLEAGVLRGETAFGGDVDDEEGLAAVLGEVVGLAFGVLDGDGVEVGHCGGGRGGGRGGVGRSQERLCDDEVGS